MARVIHTRKRKMTNKTPKYKSKSKSKSKPKPKSRRAKKARKIYKMKGCHSKKRRQRSRRRSKGKGKGQKGGISMTNLVSHNLLNASRYIPHAVTNTYNGLVGNDSATHFLPWKGHY